MDRTCCEAHPAERGIAERCVIRPSTSPGSASLSNGEAPLVSTRYERRGTADADWQRRMPRSRSCVESGMVGDEWVRGICVGHGGWCQHAPLSWVVGGGDSPCVPSSRAGQSSGGMAPSGWPRHLHLDESVSRSDPSSRVSVLRLLFIDSLANLDVRVQRANS